MSVVEFDLFALQPHGSSATQRLPASATAIEISMRSAVLVITQSMHVSPRMKNRPFRPLSFGRRSSPKQPNKARRRALCGVRECSHRILESREKPAWRPKTTKRELGREARPFYPGLDGVDARRAWETRVWEPCALAKALSRSPGKTRAGFHAPHPAGAQKTL